MQGFSNIENESSALVSCQADIAENDLLAKSPSVLDILLKDHSVSHHFGEPRNIFWATSDYEELGPGYAFLDPIRPELITGERGLLIQPRAKKSRKIQQMRIVERAEVFTPTWVCNKQNNLVDAAWFGREGVFNVESDEGDSHAWVPSEGKVVFGDEAGRTWTDYVLAPRLEMTCGEAPYITSRYDATVCGDVIPVNMRIGLLDRKLRVVSENTSSSDEWLVWAFNALHSTYGFEWQGDSLLLAREAILFTFKEHYEDIFRKPLPSKVLENAAYIISWNIWQMDGLKCVVPKSCEWAAKVEQRLFADSTTAECPACKRGDTKGHLGIRCLVVEWKKVTLKEPHRTGTKKSVFVYPQMNNPIQKKSYGV